MTVFNVRDTIGIKEFEKNDYRNPWRPRLGVISCEQMRVPARGISPSYNGRKKNTTNLKQGKGFVSVPCSKRALDIYS